ncbi:MAG: hypothetical protein ACJAVI_003962 [Candidatus Azotimanducaceae bacterium]|jgi:hypothetical protein
MLGNNGVHEMQTGRLPQDFGKNLASITLKLQRSLVEQD